MFRLAASVALSLLFVAATAQAGQYGTAKEAKAMLQRAVAAVKEDKGKALDMFNKGEGGFKDRDLYVFCANTSDGILTAARETSRAPDFFALTSQRYAASTL
jgi:hypothetical protein